ncbi:glycosyltransferase [Massilia sp. GCM10023247]|uniref:glycosyltransferase n=1 Tax=Massilia sp. GCM10023247 TaxID=3252643 RepID=UPI0036192E19
MRIVIDLQGAQSESRFRGIGRYSLALALGIARNAGEHEVWLVLNGALGAAIGDIRSAFAGLVPRERIRVFDIVTPSAEIDPGNSARTRANELLREYFIAQLQPDAVLVTSLFEGLVDNSVVSLGRFMPSANTAVILYDLIPLLNPAAYLGTEVQRRYYAGKIDSLRHAGLLLAISDYSRQEALDALEVPADKVVSISTAVDGSFVPAPTDDAQLAALRAQFSLRGEFLMYAPGGCDSRKNLDGLISAFSQLPPALRARYQLLIASKLNDSERLVLEQQAQRCGLQPHELILTGYVSDATLIALYRSCALFVFPSKHEGFGLPALEAMSCGAPVIGANTTSVPEVIGWDEALFDPHDPAAISAKIAQVLGDPAMLERLRAHGHKQAQAFSWDHTARRAVHALEQHHARAPHLAPMAPGTRPRIAFVSPLPPERTGIADHAVRVLLTLLPSFDIDLVTEQASVVLPPALSALPCRNAAWLYEHADDYDHLIYQFGNSPFHSYMVPLLAAHPGVVVLHDFYLSSMLAYEEMNGTMPGIWSRALFDSHGYHALQMSTTPEGWEQAKQAYPSNLGILQNATHVIVHSEFARQLARTWYGPEAARDWSQAPLPRALPAEHDRAAARAALGIRPDAFLVCNFGFVAPTKHCLELLDAWVAAGLPADTDCELVFVGENHGADYGAQLNEAIRAAGAGERIRISGWISNDDYFRYLQAADLAVQLRTSSRGESSATVLDCMIHGVPTIINANGSMAEFPADAAWMLPDLFSQDELTQALLALRKDDRVRQALGRAALALMAVRNSPERCAAQYAHALGCAAERRQTGRARLYPRLLDIPGLEVDDTMLQQYARSIAHAPDALAPRQLLVDVTNIARNDLKTGIERVVRTQLLELLQLPDSGMRIEPVYLCHEGGVTRCRYARRYTFALLGIPELAERGDDLVEVRAGDIYYSADYSPHAVMDAANEGLFADWRMRGAEVHFLLHDLLPILRPEFFPSNTDLTHAAWLTCITRQADQIIGISRAVADELREWLDHTAPIEHKPRIAVLHHGADVGGPVPPAVRGTPRLEQIAARPSFLMVGTIEPRKGHLQAIDAFDRLWAQGIDTNLVIVGNEGWKPLPDAERRTIPRIVERLRSHPELGRRLLWLTGVEDDELQQIYLASSCLLAPSEGEGFGLPLIEGARYGLPLLARDIPVFREVAGDGASYFSGLDDASLSAAIADWLARRAAGHVTASSVSWITWKENVRRLMALLQPQAIPASQQAG